MLFSGHHGKRKRGAINVHVAVVLLIMVSVSASILLYSYYESILPTEQESGGAQRTRVIMRVEEGHSANAWGLAVNVTNPHPTALSNYPVRLVLDSGNFANWTLVSPNSIYFTQDPEGNTPLYYWVEEIDKTLPRAVLWVLLPSLPAGPGANATVYLWFSPLNPYADYNDPKTVFTFFDHFDGNILDPLVWDSVFLTNSTLQDSVLRINKGGLILASPLPIRLQDGYAVEVRVSFEKDSPNYSGVIPEASSSPSTRGGNYDVDATILFMRYVNSYNLVTYIGDGTLSIVNNYTIHSGNIALYTTVDGEWYTTGFGVNDTGVALWVNNPTSPVAQFSVASWAKDMRYITLGAFNAADGGSTADIQDTLYDWVRIRPWVFPEPSFNLGAEWVQAAHVKLYVRNLGSETITLDSAYVYDISDNTLITQVDLPPTQLPPNSVVEVPLSFTGSNSGNILVIVKSKEGASARYVAAPE